MKSLRINGVSLALGAGHKEFLLAHTSVFEKEVAALGRQKRKRCFHERLYRVRGNCPHYHAPSWPWRPSR